MARKGAVLYPQGGTVRSSDVVYSCYLEYNGELYCYNSAWNGVNYRITLDISKDGFRFVAKGVVLPIEGGTLDATHVNHPFFLSYNGAIWCFYSGVATGYSLSCAVSHDGLNFIKKGCVLTKSSTGGDIDDDHVYGIALINDSGRFGLSYEAYGSGSVCEIAFAFSKDLLNFTKKGVVIPYASGAGIDISSALTAYPMKKDGSYFFPYGAFDSIHYSNALATGKNLLIPVKKGCILRWDGGGTLELHHVWTPQFCIRNGNVFMQYICSNGANNYVLISCCKDAMNFWRVPGT